MNLCRFSAEILDIIMKKYLFAAFCLAALSLAHSCRETGPEYPSGGTRVEFHAGSHAMTRTQLAEGNSVVWVAGDEISVFDAAGTNNRFSTGDSGQTATFAGTVNGEGTYYALYPYSDAASISGTVISSSLPPAQDAVAGGFASGLNPSVAVDDGNNNLLFKNVCALVKFTIGAAVEAEVVRASLSGNDGEPLAGPISIDASSMNPAAVPDANFAETVIDLAGPMGSGGTFCFVVVPGSLSSGLTISLYDGSGNVWTRKGSSPVELTAGHVLNLGELNPDVFSPAAGYEIVDGTYHVYNGDGLLAWASDPDVLNRNVVLEKDIDMSGKVWTPVGGGLDTGYAGDFDGNGKFINEITVSSDAANVGFFGALASGGKVHDVKFSGADVNGGSTSYAGVVAGASLGVIEDCNVRESEVHGNYAGAIAGNNSVQVNGCNAIDVNVSGAYAAGGIAGTSYGKIEYCTLSGNSTISAEGGSASCAGGIVGMTSQESGVSTSGRVLKCAVDGATVSGIWAGGITGENSFGIVAQCIVNEVTVTHDSSAASARLGGVVGYNTRGDVVASYSAFSTIGSDGLVSEAEGGIVGYNYNRASHVYGCYSTHVYFLGGVSGDESGVGSIAGYTSGHVTSCYAVLPDGVSGIGLVGKGQYVPDHCVAPGATDYSVLVTGVDNLNADDGSVWEAAKIWDVTASGTPAIVSDYICNPPEETQP